MKKRIAILLVVVLLISITGILGTKFQHTTNSTNYCENNAKTDEIQNIHSSQDFTLSFFSGDGCLAIFHSAPCIFQTIKYFLFDGTMSKVL